MRYKIGWEETPEMKLLSQHRQEMLERLEKERLRDLRKLEIWSGIACFCWVLALFIPLIVKGLR